MPDFCVLLKKKKKAIPLPNYGHNDIKTKEAHCSPNSHSVEGDPRPT